ncbi:AI-2E family transporter [Desulfonatronum thiodismutans]|uniref:AI-2E family transporter n=1 Tax=Desulfonatronum thiodismutans TaxID=159290 RepID=UPI0006896741|nr:AI-2E family transporter [Desulfonatronum thiodismutans]
MSRPDISDYLTPLQRRLISVALVLLALNLIGAFFFGVFLLLQGLVVYFSNVLWPLAVAGILALLLKPLVHWFQRILHIGRVTTIILLYGIVLLTLALLGALILPEILSQVRSLIEHLPVLAEQLSRLIARLFPDAATWAEESLNPEVLREHLQSWTEHLQKIIQTSLPALNTMGEFLGRTFTLVAGTAIIPVYLFFFLLTDKDPLRALDEQLSFISPWLREDITFLTGEFARIMVAFFRGQILIGLIMGVLMAIGFTLAGLKFGTLLGIVIGLLNIIPYLGSLLGLITVLPLAYLQQDGGFFLLALVLAVFVAVQLLESYLLTPRIMSRGTGLHPLVIIIAIFFWGKALGGILGMILAIPLTAFFVVVWRLVRKKYLAVATDRNQSLPEAESAS